MVQHLILRYLLHSAVHKDLAEDLKGITKGSHRFLNYESFFTSKLIQSVP